MSSAMIPLRHRLMMLLGNQLQEAGAMKAALYQLRLAHRFNMHVAPQMAASAASRSAYSSSTVANGSSASGARPSSSTNTSASSSAPGVGNVNNGVPTYDWQTSAWAYPSTPAASCWTPFRGWHRWACAGRNNYYGGRYDRYDGDWCSPHRWGRHRRHVDWTPEQLQQWEQFQKQIWSKAEEWSKWAVRWGEEVARATQRTAGEWATASARGGPHSSSAWTSTSSYSSGGHTRSLTITMREQASQYLVEVATPGLPRDNIKITLNDGRLTIATRPITTNTTSASTTGTAVTSTTDPAPSTSSTPQAGETASEAVDSVGHIELPPDVNTSSISAHYANGMLTMSLPKRVVPTTDIPIQ